IMGNAGEPTLKDGSDDVALAIVTLTDARFIRVIGSSLLLPTTAVPKSSEALLAERVPFWLEELPNNPWQPGIAKTATSRIKRPAQRSQRELRSISVVPFQAATRVRAAGELECPPWLSALSLSLSPSTVAGRMHLHIEASVEYATRCRKCNAMCAEV